MDPSSFPKQYGGELDWEWGDPPLLDEPARQLAGGLELPVRDGEKRPGFMKGPVLFQGDKIAVLGTENGQPRRRTIPVPQQTTTDDTAVREPASQEPEKTEANSDLETVTEVASETPTLNENEKVPLETANEAVPVSNEMRVV